MPVLRQHRDPPPAGVTLLWLQQDLRLDDHPALAAALARGGAVVPVFVDASRSGGDWPAGTAARRWLNASLAALAGDLRTRGSRLVLREGEPAAVLGALARETGAGAVFWTRRHEPAARAAETAVVRGLAAAGVAARAVPGALLHEPDTIATGDGGPYHVFTPFARACLRRGEPSAPAAPPDRLPAPPVWPESAPIGGGDMDAGGDGAPGEAGARRRLARALDEALPGYAAGRDRPDRPGTTRLSPHLHWGEISPRRVWHAVLRRVEGAGDPGLARGAEALLRQLLWREFAHHLLWHHPHTATAPLRAEFAALPWRDDPAGLDAWRRGETGYPLVDAGMRELAATGWMHNRARMVCASFLVKHLLVPWQEGARHFWETLTDADLADNTLGWQWTAGCGADAAPFFRIFNPELQGRRFDPDGAYVRRWVPELSRLPATAIHQPWRAPAAVLSAAGLRPGRDYPRPLVDHATARARALAGLAALRRG